MSDTATTAAKRTRNRRARMQIDPPTQTVTFSPFKPGTHEPDGRTFVAELSRLPPAIVTLLALDRLRNKIMDSYADPKSDIIAQCGETYKLLLAGTWAAPRGETAERTTLFAEAYASLKKLDLEDAKARINSILAGDDDDRKRTLDGWRRHPQIVAEMARISAAKAAEREKAARRAAKGSAEPDFADL